MAPVPLPWEQSYEVGRFLFRRGLALTYLAAFLVAARQFPGLCGEDGILPYTRFVDRVPFRRSPSLFHVVQDARVVRAAAWGGAVLAAFAFVGVTEWFGTAVSMLAWALLWVLYLSFVNVGQVFYGYGWESMLLETGFLAVFLGASATAAPFVVMLLLRWVLFRTMFGAGLIKLRGDACWRDLTCMDYHYETQPLPNPLSWVFDKLPRWWHKVEVLGNHVVELAVPFLLFAPQPFAAVGGLAIILFQGWLMLSGNFSWLNFLTAVLAFSTFTDAQLAFLPVQELVPVPLGAAPVHPAHAVVLAGLVAVVAWRSVGPVRNMLSRGQVMNTSFDPLHLVNAYGAFGSITKTRYEVELQATQAADPDEDDWEPYRLPAKPGEPGRRPPQVAPYHLRLDWQLWFAAMTPRPRRSWFPRLLIKLLDGDDAVEALFREVPFDDPPEKVRAVRYRYTFTSLQEWRETGDWWTRERVGTYQEPVSRDDPALQVRRGFLR